MGGRSCACLYISYLHKMEVVSYRNCLFFFTFFNTNIISLTLGFLDCGLPSNLVRRVVGGTNAQHGAWPWQIALFINGEPVCGGSIIDSYHVLTASHCVLNRRTGHQYKPHQLSVRVGKNDFRHYDSGERIYDVASSITMPGFKFKTFLNDIAILRLRQKISFNDYVKPVCLPTTPVIVGQMCVLTGWGRISTTSKFPHYRLQQVSMPIVNNKKCRQLMKTVASLPIGSHSVCAGYGQGKISGCQGDSGSPLVCKADGRWQIHGVVSWGPIDCGNKPKEYTIYANVYHLKKFIENALQHDRI